jgi:hypothetical protein
MINRQKLALLALLAANCAEAFTFISPRNAVANKLPCRSFQTSYTTLLKAGEDDAEKDMLFIDAEQAIKDQEDAERADARGNGSEQVSTFFWFCDRSIFLNTDTCLVRLYHRSSFICILLK